MSASELGWLQPSAVACFDGVRTRDVCCSLSLFSVLCEMPHRTRPCCDSEADYYVASELRALGSPVADVEAVRAVIDGSAADTEDVWSCSRIFRHHLVDWFALRGHSMRVVEIGTYGGGTTRVLARLFASVTTIDNNSTLLGKASESMGNLANVRFLYADTALHSWWEHVGRAEVLLIDGNHEYEFAKRDLANGLTYVRPRFVILDDYGALPTLRRLVEEFANRGMLVQCRGLGRSSGDTIPTTDRKFVGPEAVVCATREGPQRIAKPSVVAYNVDEAENEGGSVFELHHRRFVVCPSPCHTVTDLMASTAGTVDFVSGPGGREGNLTFSQFYGGVEGAWLQPDEEQLVVLANANGHRLVFFFPCYNAGLPGPFA